jgi:hypothetical protein
MNLAYRHPEEPAFFASGPRDLRSRTALLAGDPSLRLKNGYAQDDAIDESRCHQKFKMTHYPGTQHLAVRIR